MDDRVHRGGGVQELVARGLELADDRGAQEGPGAGHVHPSEPQLVHRETTVGTTA